jgi:hypothetical protein
VQIYKIDPIRILLGFHMTNHFVYNNYLTPLMLDFHQMNGVDDLTLYPDEAITFHS